MKFNFKKLVSVVSVAAMLGSTVGLAAAASFPAPFIKNNSPDVAVVWGSHASSSDLVGVTDIVASLQSDLVSSQLSAPVSGDNFVQLSRGSQNLEMGQSISDVFGSNVDKDKLPALLADGTYSNGNNEYSYEQKINIGNMKLIHFSDSNFNNDQPTVGFDIKSGQEVLNYTLQFSSDAKSDVSSGKLVDLQNTNLNILGKDYYILSAENTSGNQANLVLLDAAQSVILNQGETKTLTVGNETYDVSVSYIDSDHVKLSVNGETTKVLSSGDTFKLKDGSYIGVKDVLSQGYAGGVSQVEFSIGSGKLELNSGSNVQLNGDTINGLVGYVNTNADGNQVGLKSIKLQWLADDDMFLTNNSKITMPGFGAVQLSMSDFMTADKEITSVRSDGDSSIQLDVPLSEGSAKLNILYANETGQFIGIGQRSDALLATSAGSSLVYNATSGADRQFVVSWSNSADSESYLLSASIDNSNGANRTTVTNKLTGETIAKDKTVGDSITIGNVQLTVSAITNDANGKTVTFNAANGVKFDRVFSKDGLQIILPTSVSGSDSYVLQFTEADKNGNVAAGNSFNLTLGHNSNGKVQVSSSDTGSQFFEIGDSNDYVSYVNSALASKVIRHTGSDQDSADVEYHKSESFANVFLSAPNADISAPNTGVVRLGSVAFADSEAVSLNSNLIVVGGSAVNSVAADLLGGNLYGSDFTAKTGVGAGQFVIETFSRANGKVATMVAGYNAEDTMAGVKYLLNNKVDTSVGQKIIGPQ